MRRAMVIDDQETVRSLVRQVLETWDAELEVEEAIDGFDAMVNLECRPYDFLVCDVRMPQMDGIELLSRVRALPAYAHTPILMLTAEDEPERIFGAFSLGATSYLTKPFNYEDLMQALKDLNPPPNTRQAA